MGADARREAFASHEELLTREDTQRLVRRLWRLLGAYHRRIGVSLVLIVLWTGHKPTKRTFEMLCLYFQGWESEAELLAHVHQLNKTKKDTS